MFGALIILKKSKNILNLEKVYSVCSAHRDMLKRMPFLEGKCVAWFEGRMRRQCFLSWKAQQQSKHQLRNNHPGGPCNALKQLTDN